MLNAQAIVPTIKKYTHDLCPMIATKSMWNHLEVEMIRLALKSAEMELKGELYSDPVQFDRYDRLLMEIQHAIQAEAIRLYGKQD